MALNMSPEELKALQEKYNKEIKALVEKKKEAMRLAQAKIAKVEAAKRAKLRKADSHIKIVIGGYFLSKMRKGELGLDTLDKIAETVGEKDKELFKELKAILSKQSAKKPQK